MRLPRSNRPTAVSDISLEPPPERSRMRTNFFSEGVSEMNSVLPRRRPAKAFATAALAAAFTLIALVSSSLPSSFARPQVPTTTRANYLQQTPDLSFVGIFHQTNLLS